LEPYNTPDRKPEEFNLVEKKEGKVFQRGSTTFKFLGASMEATKSWHEALSSLTKVTMGVVATGTTHNEKETVAPAATA
jgi:hypothetical protein